MRQGARVSMLLLAMAVPRAAAAGPRMDSMVFGLPVDFEACKQRVSAALQAESWTGWQDYGNGWLAYKPDTSLAAHCTHGPDRGTVVNLVLAGGGDLRAAMRRLASHIRGEEVCAALDGSWRWFNGWTVAFAPGRFDSEVDGTWSVSVEPAPRGCVYTLRWDSGYADTLALSADRNRLEGRNERGDTVWGERGASRAMADVGAPSRDCSDPTGSWSWFNGWTIEVAGDGSLSSSGGPSGRWERLPGGGLRMTWSHGYTDTLTLAADGRRLGGANQQGTSVTGERRGDCPRRR